MNAPAPILDFRGAGRRFGPITALAQVTFSLAPAESLLLLGPNGAGKSTLLRLAAGVARPTGGKVLVGGFDLRTPQGARARATTGFLGHRSFLFDHLTPLENLALYGRLYGTGGHQEKRAEELLEEVGLARAAHRHVRGFSRGMMQRLALARALFHKPRLLLLDEPATGLDTEGRERLEAILQRQRGQGVSLVVVSHHAESSLRWADRVLVLRRGRITADAPASSRTAAEWMAFAVPSASGEKA